MRIKVYFLIKCDGCRGPVYSNCTTCTINLCDNCQSWYHPSSQSPFHIGVSGGNMTAGSTLFVDEDKASNKTLDSFAA